MVFERTLAEIAFFRARPAALRTCDWDESLTSSALSISIYAGYTK